MPARRALNLTSKVHFELQTRPNGQIHTKYVKTGRWESIHLNSSCLKVNENSWEEIRCVSIFCFKVTDWCFINVNQRKKNAKRKLATGLNLNKIIDLISINLSIHTVKTVQCSFTFAHF